MGIKQIQFPPSNPVLTSEKRSQLAQHLRTHHNAPLHQVLDLAQELQLLADAHDQLLLVRLLHGRIATVGQQPLVDEQKAQLLPFRQLTQSLRLGAQFGEHAHDLVQHRVVGAGQLMVRQLLAPVQVQPHGGALDGGRLAGRPVQVAAGVGRAQLAEQAIVGVEELAELAQLALAGDGCESANVKECECVCVE